MKTYIIAIGLLVHLLSVNALPSIERLTHGRNQRSHFVKRDGRDCGTWVMDCSKAAAACNNACYHMRCHNPATETMTYDHPPKPSAAPATKKARKEKPVDNRKDSGCTIAGGPSTVPSVTSICRAMPFSQIFHDPLLGGIDRVDKPNSNDFQCDEWPMNAVKQSAFVDGQTPIRNSLRCIPSGENGSGGIQLNQFLMNNSPYRDGTEAEGYVGKKTCFGLVRDEDYWKVEFLHTDDITTPHCQKWVADRADKTGCDSDNAYFHLTKKVNQGGKITFPYNYETDSHYKQDSVAEEPKSCSVEFRNEPTSNAKAFSIIFSDAGVATALTPSVAANDGTTSVTINADSPRKVVATRGAPLGQYDDYAGDVVTIRFGVQDQPKYFALDNYEIGFSSQNWGLWGVPWLNRDRTVVEDSRNPGGEKKIGSYCQTENDENVFTCYFPC